MGVMERRESDENCRKFISIQRIIHISKLMERDRRNTRETIEKFDKVTGSLTFFKYNSYSKLKLSINHNYMVITLNREFFMFSLVN